MEPMGCRRNVALVLLNLTGSVKKHTYLPYHELIGAFGDTDRRPTRAEKPFGKVTHQLRWGIEQLLGIKNFQVKITSPQEGVRIGCIDDD